jgi:hypothetical protein
MLDHELMLQLMAGLLPNDFISFLARDFKRACLTFEINSSFKEFY